MKKTIQLLVLLLGTFSIMSFDSSVVKPVRYKVTCGGSGATYWFECDCGLAAAKEIGALMCAMPISEP